MPKHVIHRDKTPPLAKSSDVTFDNQIERFIVTVDNIKFIFERHSKFYELNHGGLWYRIPLGYKVKDIQEAINYCAHIKVNGNALRAAINPDTLEATMSYAKNLIKIAEEGEEYYVLADPKEADKIKRSGDDSKATFKGTAADAAKFAKDKMKGKDAVLMKRDSKGKYEYSVGEANTGSLGLHVIATPTGKFVFVGSVPKDLDYITHADGSSLTDAEWKEYVSASSPWMVRKSKGYVERSFDSKESAVKYAKEHGYNIKESNEIGGNMSRAKELQKLVESAKVDEMYALGADHIVNFLKKTAYERFDVDPSAISVVPWPEDGSDFNIQSPLSEAQYNELSEKITRTYPLYVVEWAGSGTMKFYSGRTVGNRDADTVLPYPREGGETTTGGSGSETNPAGRENAWKNLTGRVGYDL